MAKFKVDERSCAGFCSQCDNGSTKFKRCSQINNEIIKLYFSTAVINEKAFEDTEHVVS